MSTASNVTNPSQAGLPVDEVVRSAEKQLVQLLQERAEVMKRIGTIKQTLVGLAKVFGDSLLSPELLRLMGRGTPRPQPGFTRACRVVLMESGTPLEARQGCNELQRRFPDLLERHKIPLASVTTVFNRLVGYSEARSFVGGNGRRVWEWVADNGASKSPASTALPSFKPRLISPANGAGKQ